LIEKYSQGIATGLFNQQRLVLKLNISITNDTKLSGVSPHPNFINYLITQNINFKLHERKKWRRFKILISGGLSE